MIIVSYYFLLKRTSQVGDSHIRKTQPPVRYTPMPDSMISAAHNAQQVNSSVLETPGGGVGSAIQDLTSGYPSLFFVELFSEIFVVSVGKAQQLQLGMTLERASLSVAGQSAVNTLGYMTDLNAHRTANEDMVDINKARFEEFFFFFFFFLVSV